MKKLILIALALFLTGLLPSLSFSQTWHSTNQVTVAWDTVTLPDGISGAVAYDVYTVRSTAAKSTAVKIARATSTQITIGFSAEGRYFVGVKSVRIDAGTDVSESTISWSDDPLVTATGPFGVVYIVSPRAPAGIRLLLLN